MRRIVIAAAALALAALSCQKAPEGYREALANFDDFVGERCPSESLIAIARALGARSDDVRVVHYGPTGQQDHTYYFAALSRDGAVLAGVLDEASNTVAAVAYENKFGRDDFVWVMKCLRNDPPFGDRKVRYGPALPVEIKRRVDGVAVKFVDGWLEESQKWSTGEVEVNLAGTKLLREDHALDFAIR